jgi:hypothetical protein
VNETNRSAIVLFAAFIVIVMAVIIFLTWAADDKVVDRLGDMVEYMDAHRDNAGRLIVTLAALIVAVMALLVIILELAPEEEEKELRVEQAGATTIVPAQALRLRLQEALLALPAVSAARARVTTRDKGIAAILDLTVAPGTNVGAITQDAIRAVVDAVQSDLGLPVSGVPVVRVTFGPAKAEPVASSVAQPPQGPASPPPPVEPAPGASDPGGAGSAPPGATGEPTVQDTENPQP